MKTAVVILNYNTRDYLKKFLPGLIASCQGLDAQVIVADNASHDGSTDLLGVSNLETVLNGLNKAST